MRLKVSPVVQSTNSDFCRRKCECVGGRKKRMICVVCDNIVLTDFGVRYKVYHQQYHVRITTLTGY